ncbi:hypothetical protein AYI69_g5461, partial [Smittium culicis]
MKHNYW